MRPQHLTTFRPLDIFQTLASTTILVFQCYEFYQTYLYAIGSLPYSRWVPEWMVDSRLLALLLSWTCECSLCKMYIVPSHLIIFHCVCSSVDVIEVFYRIDLKPFTWVPCLADDKILSDN